MSYTSKTFSEIKAKHNVEYRVFSDKDIDVMFSKIESWINNKNLYKVFRFIIGLMWMINNLHKENKNLREENRKLRESFKQTQQIVRTEEWIDNGHPSKDWNKVYEMGM